MYFTVGFFNLCYLYCGRGQKETGEKELPILNLYFLQFLFFFLAVCALHISPIQFCETRIPHLN